MADDIRQRIIASVFSTRSASGSLEQTYIAHLKIYEDDGPDPSGANNGGKKVRYVLLGCEYFEVSFLTVAMFAHWL